MGELLSICIAQGVPVSLYTLAPYLLQYYTPLRPLKTGLTWVHRVAVSSHRLRFAIEKTQGSQTPSTARLF